MPISEMSRDQEERRVFVPLAKEPFVWFEKGHKQWELRRYGRQYTERQVRAGREVELRHGYSSHQSLWGVITDTMRAKSVRDFFAHVDYETVIPTAASQDEAIRIAERILRIPERAEVAVFAFRVELTVTVVPLARRFLPLVRSGTKTSTIRRGVRSWMVGPAVLRSNGEEVNIRITEIRITTAASLTDGDAVRDGFGSLDELLDALKDFYPDLSASDKLTIASFTVI